MKISFVIPAYNEEKSILGCLESVRKEIVSNKYDVEVIVVNNKSTDRTKEIAESFDWVRVVDEMEKGLVRARRAGYLVSDGELVANVDADTILPSGWLRKVMNEFEKDEKLVALSGPFIYYDLSLLSRLFVKVFYFFGYLIHLFNHYVLGVGAMLQGGNFIIKRDAFDKVGGYDTSIEFYGEDTDVAKRLNSVGKVKWTFGLPMYTSGRRLKKEGIIVMGLKYAVNYVWMTFTGKPFTKKYIDIRK